MWETKNCTKLSKLCRTWWNRIDSKVVLGALPFKGETSRQIVEQENVRGVVSMNESYELAWLCNSQEEWRQAGVTFLQLPTVDIFSAPCQEGLKRGVDFIRCRIRSIPWMYLTSVVYP